MKSSLNTQSIIQPAALFHPAKRTNTETFVKTGRRQEGNDLFQVCTNLRCRWILIRMPVPSPKVTMAVPP